MTLLRRDPLLVLYLAFVCSLALPRPHALLVGKIPVQWADLLIVACYAGWGVQWLRGRALLKFDALLGVSLAYIAVLAASVLVAPNERTSGLVKLAAYAAYVLLPALTVRIVDSSRERLTWVVRSWLWGGAIAVTVGAFGLLSWYASRNGIGKWFACPTYGLLPSGNYPRLCSAFLSPNTHANYLTVSLAFALGCGGLVAQGAKRVYIAVAVVVGTIVAMFTLSAGMGGYAIAAGVVLTAHSQRRQLEDAGPRIPAKLIAAGASVVALFFAVSMLAALVPHGQGQLAMGSRDIDFTGSARPAIWKSAIATIQREPWLGKGYGTLVASSDDPMVILSPDQRAQLVGKLPPTGLEAHNVWLNVMGQAGVIGLGVFAVVIYLYLRGIRSLPTVSRGPDDLPGVPRGLLRASLVGALAGAFFYHGLFGALEETRHLLGLFALIAASVATLAVNASVRPATN